jgi:hypothetical protein
MKRAQRAFVLSLHVGMDVRARKLSCSLVARESDRWSREPPIAPLGRERHRDHRVSLPGTIEAHLGDRRIAVEHHQEEAAPIYPEEGRFSAFAEAFARSLDPARVEVVTGAGEVELVVPDRTARRSIHRSRCAWWCPRMCRPRRAPSYFGMTMGPEDGRMAVTFEVSHFTEFAVGHGSLDLVVEYTGQPGPYDYFTVFAAPFTLTRGDLGVSGSRSPSSRRARRTVPSSTAISRGSHPLLFGEWSFLLGRRRWIILSGGAGP